MSPHKLRHTYGANFIPNGDHITLLWHQLGQNKIKIPSLYENLSIRNNEKVLTRMTENRVNPIDKEKQGL